MLKNKILFYTARMIVISFFVSAPTANAATELISNTGDVVPQAGLALAQNSILIEVRAGTPFLTPLEITGMVRFPTGETPIYAQESSSQGVHFNGGIETESSTTIKFFNRSDIRINHIEYPSTGVVQLYFVSTVGNGHIIINGSLLSTTTLQIMFISALDHATHKAFTLPDSVKADFLFLGGQTSLYKGAQTIRGTMQGFGNVSLRNATQIRLCFPEKPVQPCPPFHFQEFCGRMILGAQNPIIYTLPKLGTIELTDTEITFAKEGTVKYLVVLSLPIASTLVDPLSTNSIRTIHIIGQGIIFEHLILPIDIEVIFDFTPLLTASTEGLSCVGAARKPAVNTLTVKSMVGNNCRFSLKGGNKTTSVMLPKQLHTDAVTKHSDFFGTLVYG